MRVTSIGALSTTHDDDLSIHPSPNHRPTPSKNTRTCATGAVTATTARPASSAADDAARRRRPGALASAVAIDRVSTCCEELWWGTWWLDVNCNVGWGWDFGWPPIWCVGTDSTTPTTNRFCIMQKSWGLVGAPSPAGHSNHTPQQPHTHRHHPISCGALPRSPTARLRYWSTSQDGHVMAHNPKSVD